MRLVRRALAAVLVVSTWTLAADERDPFVGRWEIRLRGSGSVFQPLMLVEIERKDAGLSGSTLSTTLPGALPACRDLVVEGGELRFIVDIGPGVRFRARRAGDRLEGRAELGTYRTEWIGAATNKDKLEPPPTPEDQKVYAAAVGLPDGVEREAALEKFLADFPVSGERTPAYSRLLDGYLQAMPIDEAKVSSLIDRRIAETPAPGRAALYNEIAERLASNDVLLDRALELIDEAVSLLGSQTRPAVRAVYLTTLGQVRFKRKEHDQAEDSLTRAAASGETGVRLEAGLYLGKTREARGNVEGALEAYLGAAAYGMTADLKASLEMAWVRKNGTRAGLHERIDAAIAARPRSFEPGQYERPAGNPGRLVLAELFTGADCRPCVAADLAFAGLLERFDRATVAVLEYHLHVPSPDPMANVDADFRSRYYGVAGAPSAFVDGAFTYLGGGSANAAPLNFVAYRDSIQRRLAIPPAVRFAALELRRSGGSVALSGEVVVDPAASKRLETCRLRLVAAQEVVHYTGGNGIHLHRFVARKMLGTPVGTRLAGAGEKTRFSESFHVAELAAALGNYLTDVETSRAGFRWKELPAAIEPGSLAIVAFVQDDATREILQAAFVK